MEDDTTRADLARAIAEASRAGQWERVRELTEVMLTLAKQSVKLPDVQPEVSAKGPVVKPPSMRAIATWLGCTAGFLSQARAGTSRIRYSWAKKIAKVRPDWPATVETWPKGWVPGDEPPKR